MTNEELLKTLEKLHAELSQGSQLDDQTIQSMRTLLDDIHAALARSGHVDPSQNPSTVSLSSRVQDLISDFEMRHPRLTTVLSQITERLADMGI